MKSLGWVKLARGSDRSAASAELDLASDIARWTRNEFVTGVTGEGRSCRALASHAVVDLCVMPSRPSRVFTTPPAAGEAVECTPTRRANAGQLSERRAKTGNLQPYASLFKALADPTRVEIVAMLAQASEPLCACDIEGHFELAQATLSHHLKILREAGVLTSERRGTWIFYSLEPSTIERLSEFSTLLDA